MYLDRVPRGISRFLPLLWCNQPEDRRGYLVVCGYLLLIMQEARSKTKNSLRRRTTARNSTLAAYYYVVLPNLTNQIARGGRKRMKNFNNKKLKKMTGSDDDVLEARHVWNPRWWDWFGEPEWLPAKNVKLYWSKSYVGSRSWEGFMNWHVSSPIRPLCLSDSGATMAMYVS